MGSIIRLFAHVYLYFMDLVPQPGVSAEGGVSHTWALLPFSIRGMPPGSVSPLCQGSGRSGGGGRGRGMAPTVSADTVSYRPPPPTPGRVPCCDTLPWLL